MSSFFNKTPKIHECQLTQNMSVGILPSMYLVFPICQSFNSCHILIRAEFSSMPSLGNKHFAALLGGLEYPPASRGSPRSSPPPIKKKIAFKYVVFNIFWQKITKDDFYFNAFSYEKKKLSIKNS